LHTGHQLFNQLVLKRSLPVFYIDISFGMRHFFTLTNFYDKGKKVNVRRIYKNAVNNLERNMLKKV
jgi:hypothetical protein